MEPPFDEMKLARQLEGMPRWKAIVFGLAICERMLPGFVAFADESGHQGADVLRASLDQAWAHLRSGTVTANLSRESEACESVAPDTEDYDTLYTSAALDAATAASLLMQAFGNLSVEPIVEIASLARDTVDMLVQVKEDWGSSTPDLENKILSHPLMQNELRRQAEDLEFLRALPDDLSGSISRIEPRWKSNPVNIIGLAP